MPSLNNLDNPTETQECEAFHQWLELKNIPHHHCANESQSGRRDAVIRNARNKRMGQSRGFWDYIIFIPIKKVDRVKLNSPLYQIIFMEMKRKKGGKLSDEQKKWGDIFKRTITSRYLEFPSIAVCNGFDEARKFVEDRL